jgi:serine protease Do
MSGLWLGRLEGEYLVIRQVHPGSPAAEAGITVEDRIVRINGRPVREISDPWVYGPLLRRAGETVKLVLLRGGEEIEVSIALRRLI